MEKFNKYLSEIKKLLIKPGIELPGIEQHVQLDDQHTATLDNLQNNALRELKLLSFEKIKENLISLKRLEKRFAKFDLSYPGLLVKSQNGILTVNELKRKLTPLFDVIRIAKEPVSTHLVTSIYKRVLGKHGSLLKLINMTEDFLVFENENNKQFA